MKSDYNPNLRKQKEITLSLDGSKTLFSKEFNQHYHSTKDGALYESLEKYVKPSLNLTKHKPKITILDICFGIGYNTFATIYYVKKHNISTKIDIISPEFDEELVRGLKDFDYPKEFDDIKHIIVSISDNLFYKDKQFKIEVIIDDARVVIPKIEQKIDIIYQDAFSPDSNHLLWTKEYFEDIRKISKNDTILTTYSTSISTRMGLYENGFYIFVHRANLMRYSTVASLKMLDNFEYIDMELKKSRNKDAKSLRDGY